MFYNFCQKNFVEIYFTCEESMQYLFTAGKIIGVTPISIRGVFLKFSEVITWFPKFVKWRNNVFREVSEKFPESFPGKSVLFFTKVVWLVYSR